MAVLYNNKSVVTDKLVLALDANNTRSYPGSGSTWFDMASNISGSITGASWSNG